MIIRLMISGRLPDRPSAGGPLVLLRPYTLAWRTYISAALRITSGEE